MNPFPQAPSGLISRTGDGNNVQSAVAAALPGLVVAQRAKHMATAAFRANEIIDIPWSAWRETQRGNK